MKDKNIVVIGGGEGTNIVLSGLKRYTSQLTALISTFDATARRQAQPLGGAGASQPAKDVQSGWLIPPAAVSSDQSVSRMGEVRGSLIALGADKTTAQIMERLFAYHLAHPIEFSTDFGDLFLAALAEISGGALPAMHAAAQVLNVQGKVFPITLDECPLMAVLGDGTEVIVTTSRELADVALTSGLQSIRLSRPVAVLDAALEAIERADIIVLGPADLYFNIIAPLQIEQLYETLALSKAVKIFVCPLMTQSHLTTSWTASDYIRVVLNHMGGPSDSRCVIANSAPLPPEKVANKGAAGAYPVHLDIEECFSLGTNVIVRPVAAHDSLLHDPEKLARTIMFLGGGRTGRPIDGSRYGLNGYANQEVAASEPVRQALGKVSV
jgi:uncharacterized cofD-like protein